MHKDICFLCSDSISDIENRAISGEESLAFRIRSF